MDEFVNKVANSGLITFNLEDYYDLSERAIFDIKDCLFMGLVLKEKDFRGFIKTNDWSAYKNKHVAITCSADAIVPTWAYMLLANALQPYAKRIIFGDIQMLESILITEALNKVNIQDFADQRVVIKGCGDLPVPTAAYVEITAKLAPVAKSIMYGEPCSTVPIMKRQ
ncbi:MAG: DUF2480 family protein [Bacteroidota bacterium]|nr:DUF2480 family protein [Bacteroidota bacterium]